jgi:hypothetical protein
MATLEQTVLDGAELWLVDVAARVAFNSVRDAAEFPNDSTFASFVETSVGSAGGIKRT